MGMVVASFDYPVAVVLPEEGLFTAWTLDAAGEWQNFDPLVVQQITKGGQIGIKVNHPVDLGILAEINTVFTFTSPSGKQTIVNKKSSAPLIIDGSVTEEAIIAASEEGAWQCRVEVDLWTPRLWGPFYIADVVAGGSGDGDGGIDLTDDQKKLLVFAGLGILALVALRRSD